jgi:hypothetical protein
VEINTKVLCRLLLRLFRIQFRGENQKLKQCALFRKRENLSKGEKNKRSTNKHNNHREARIQMICPFAKFNGFSKRMRAARVQSKQTEKQGALPGEIVFLGAANEIVKCHKPAHFSIIKRHFPRRLENNNISLLNKRGEREKAQFGTRQ